MSNPVGNRPFTGMVILRYRKGPISANPLVPAGSGPANSDPTDQSMPDAPATGNASNSGPRVNDGSVDQEMPDAPENGSSSAADADGTVEDTPTAFGSRRALRTRTARQTAPASQRRGVCSAAVVARTERVLPLTQRQRQGLRCGIVELPWISALQPPRTATPAAAAAHVLSPSLLGMPPAFFRRIAEYTLAYQQPEELVQKATHRRMAEATKTHVLTVSSEKIVRKPSNKQVARNLNTASLTNFFLVCRQVRDVGVKVYYGSNTFKFSCEDNLLGWAEAIPSRRKSVHSIQLDSHWEVQFKNGEISVEALEIVRDHGLISTAAFRMFPNLKKVHLAVGCAVQWQHDAFQREHGFLDRAMESICWTHASQQVEYMSQFLRDSELRSRTVDVSNELIFDGAFVSGTSNEVDYGARIKAFVWKIRALEAELRISIEVPYHGRASLLPDPLLPGMTHVIAPAPIGAWTQLYVNDESIPSDSSRFGLVYPHDTWAADMSAIAADLLAPERLAMVQTKATRRAFFRAAIMSELRSSKRVANLQRISAWRAGWVTIYAELRASVAEMAKVNATLEAEARADAASRPVRVAAAQGMSRTLLLRRLGD